MCGQDSWKVFVLDAREWLVSLPSIGRAAMCPLACLVCCYDQHRQAGVTVAAAACVPSCAQFQLSSGLFVCASLRPSCMSCSNTYAGLLTP